MILYTELKPILKALLEQVREIKNSKDKTVMDALNLDKQIRKFIEGFIKLNYYELSEEEFMHQLSSNLTNRFDLEFKVTSEGSFIFVSSSDKPDLVELGEWRVKKVLSKEINKGTEQLGIRISTLTPPDNVMLATYIHLLEKNIKPLVEEKDPDTIELDSFIMHDPMVSGCLYNIKELIYSLNAMGFDFYYEGKKIT